MYAWCKHACDVINVTICAQDTFTTSFSATIFMLVPAWKVQRVHNTAKAREREGGLTWSDVSDCSKFGSKLLSPLPSIFRRANASRGPIRCGSVRDSSNGRSTTSTLARTLPQVFITGRRSKSLTTAWSKFVFSCQLDEKQTEAKLFWKKCFCGVFEDNTVWKWKGNVRKFLEMKKNGPCSHYIRIQSQERESCEHSYSATWWLGFTGWSPSFSFNLDFLAMRDKISQIFHQKLVETNPVRWGKAVLSALTNHGLICSGVY